MSAEDPYNILCHLLVGRIGAVNRGTKYLSRWFTRSIRQCGFRCIAQQSQRVTYVNRLHVLA